MFEDVPVEELVATLGDHDFGSLGTDRIDAVVAYDRLIRFAQARIAEHDAALLHERCALAVEVERAGGPDADPVETTRSVITELAMARQMSAHGAATLHRFALGLARMPAIGHLLAEGLISERVARAVVTECELLGTDGVRFVENALVLDVIGMTARRAGEAARKHVIAFDPDLAHEHAVAARSDRHLSLHALPHTVGVLELRGPIEQLTACHRLLETDARRAGSGGDERTVGQHMFDTLVERVTGLAHADQVPVEVGLLMDADTLLSEGEVPAMLAGYGPIPPTIARDLATSSQTWLRRLFTDPVDHTITGRDPRRRRFDGPLGALIRIADGQCRRPWCDCQVRDVDHRTPYAEGGTTTFDDGHALCKRSHVTRHLPGWSLRLEDDRRTTVWTTPAGHEYRSRRQPALGHRARVAERRLRAALGRPTVGRLRQ